MQRAAGILPAEATPNAVVQANTGASTSSVPFRRQDAGGTLSGHAFERVASTQWKFEPARSGCYNRRDMSGKYSFDLKSEERRRPLPLKIIVGRKENEGVKHVLLKFMAFVLFYRERLQIEPRLLDDNIPFEPDVIQLDYSLRPALWVECGECSVSKLNKLAVKIPESEIWVIKSSTADVENLHRAMEKEELRRDRYGLLGLDSAMFDEMSGLLGTRNQLTWFSGDFDPPQMQFEFNGLWFDTSFSVVKY